VFAVGWRQTGAELDEGVMLRVEIFIDVLIELLVRTGRFGSIKIAASRDIAVGRIEVECARDGFEIVDWKILSSLMSTVVLSRIHS
jgi:hypothetical protein